MTERQEKAGGIGAYLTVKAPMVPARGREGLASGRCNPRAA
jgi:hypothetical protein